MSEENSQLTTIETDLVPASALEVMQRSEIDLQISTAHKYPRSMQQFQSRARSMALIDEDTAASCIYSRPVGGGKFAEGLSVRAAEIVAASFGNIRVAATIIEQTERYVKARGMAHDLESNYACATEVIESTVKKDGSPYDERMRIVIAKSALAKARRDATFQVVPKALFKKIEGECRKLALGEGMSVTERRGRISAWITKLSIDAKRVWAVLGIAGEADLEDDHFLTLTGIKTAISDGDVTIDEAFPKIMAEGAVGKPPATKKSITELAAEEKAKAKPAPTAETPAPEKPQNSGGGTDDAKELPVEGKKPESGPSPAMFIADIKKQARAQNVSMSVLTAALVDRKILLDGEKIDDMSAKVAANVLDELGEILDAILNPNAQA